MTQIDSSELPEPILDGLFEPTGDGRVRLLAQRCGPDGVVIFPRRVRSVHCEPAELEDTALSPEAELWSWTVADLGARGVPGDTGGAKVMLAQARFPEGPVVQGYLQGDPADPPAIGAPVETVPHVVALPGGDSATTYAFRVRT